MYIQNKQKINLALKSLMLHINATTAMRNEKVKEARKPEKRALNSSSAPQSRQTRAYRPRPRQCLWLWLCIGVCLVVVSM